MKNISISLTVNNRRVKLTHLDRVIWPGESITKKDLIRYYIEISPFLLPHLKNRPLVFQRFPKGIEEKGFYQKNSPPGTPAWIKTYSLFHSPEKETKYILADNTETLVWLGNQGCIEIHPWLSSVEHLNCPDYAVFDLDPMKGSTFDEVRQVALLIRSSLSRHNLKSFPKSSGATGLQIYVPLMPRYSYEDSRNFVLYFCKAVNQVYPEITTLERRVDRREGKIYLDHLQNGKGKTLVSPYSPRPLPGAPVSMPLSWSEVEKGFTPAQFNVFTAIERVKTRGDLFAAVLTQKQNIDRFVQY